MVSKSGIYQIINAISKCIYIGSAVDLRHREQSHRNDLRRGKHINRHLQSAWRKYGESVFSFAVLEYCEAADLLTVEQRYLDATIGVREVYNICPTAGNCLGRPVKPETIAKLRGQKRSPETRERLREHALTRVQSEATKAKLRLLKTGNKASESTRQKLREVARVAIWDVKLISPSGEKFGPIVNVKKFAELNGLYPSHLSAVVSGRRLSHRGWRLTSLGECHASLDFPRK